MPINTGHLNYTNALPDWQMIRDFDAGERAVKARGRAYLPMPPDTTQTKYDAYKDRTPFLAATKRTIAGLVGVVFRRPPIVELGDNERLRPFLEEIGIDGTPFEFMARDVVAETIRMGRYGLLTDMPIDGGRPYWVGYKAEQITNWRQIIFNGRRIVDQVILSESVEYPSADNYGASSEQQYRELTLTEGGYIQIIHRAVPKSGGKPAGFVPGEQFIPTRRGSALDALPFVFVGPNGLGAEIEHSPMLDIVNQNRHHYTQSAELRHALFYAGMPVHWVSGLNQGDEVNYIVGPGNVWLVPPDGQVGISEYHGHGLTFLENAVAARQNDMAMLGARLIGASRKTASESSEVAQIRERGEHATLWTIVDSCERALTKALKQWVWWQDGNPDDVRVILNKDFVDTTMQYRDLLMVMRAWQAGAIPLDTFHWIMYEGGILPDRMTPDVMKEKLKEPGQVYVDPKLAMQTGPDMLMQVSQTPPVRQPRQQGADSDMVSRAK